MAQRITEDMLDEKQAELAQLLTEVTGSSYTAFYRGNKEYGQTNKLIINKTNVWADGMAGHTKREAYNAMRTMIATLAVVVESKEA